MLVRLVFLYWLLDHITYSQVATYTNMTMHVQTKALAVCMAGRNDTHTLVCENNNIIYWNLTYANKPVSHWLLLVNLFTLFSAKGSGSSNFGNHAHTFIKCSTNLKSTCPSKLCSLQITLLCKTFCFKNSTLCKSHQQE